MSRLPPRSRNLPGGLYVIKPGPIKLDDKGREIPREYLLPVCVVRGLIPDYARLNAGPKKRGARSGHRDEDHHHMAYEVVRLADAASEHMTVAQATAAARRAVAEAYGCTVVTVGAAMRKYGDEAREYQEPYLVELRRQKLLEK